MVNENNNNKRKPSRSERTNAKNLEYLQIVGATLDTIRQFNPVNPLITRRALGDFVAGFAARMQATNEAVVAEDTAVESQTAAFKQVRPKITQILGAVKGQGITAEPLDHLMTTIRRLRGARVNRDTPDEEPAASAAAEAPKPAKRSVSQQSIAGILEGLDRLDEQIKALPDYQPNEADFKKEAISAWIEDLRDRRVRRLNAEAAAVLARQDRDDYCYGAAAGLIFRMNTLKAYLETILPKTDARYRKIKGLRFVDNGR